MDEAANVGDVGSGVRLARDVEVAVEASEEVSKKIRRVETDAAERITAMNGSCEGTHFDSNFANLA